MVLSTVLVVSFPGGYKIQWCYGNWANSKNLFESYFKLSFPVILMMMFSHAFFSELDRCCCVCDIWCCSSPSSNWKMISYVIMRPTGLCYFLNGLYLNMVIPPSIHLNGMYLNFISTICVLFKFWNNFYLFFPCLALWVNGTNAMASPFFMEYQLQYGPQYCFGYSNDWCQTPVWLIFMCKKNLFTAGYVVIWVYHIWFLVGRRGVVFCKLGFKHSSIFNVWFFPISGF